MLAAAATSPMISKGTQDIASHKKSFSTSICLSPAPIALPLSLYAVE